MKKHLLQSLLAVALLLVCGNVWGQDNTIITFTNWSKSIQTYSSTEWTDKGCTFAYASNNQKNWSYVRMGGKSATASSYIKYGTPLAHPISEVIVNHNGKSNTNFTINYVALTVYSDKSFSQQVAEIQLTDDAAAAEVGKTGSYIFSAADGESWPANSYYKFTVNWTVSDSKNYGLDVTEIQFNHATGTSSFYTVTYDANGGTGTAPTDANEYESGDEVTVLGSNGLTKDNFTFGGWSDGSTTYQQDETFNITKNTTLTAVWNDVFYNIVVNQPAQGGTVGVTVNDVAVTSAIAGTQLILSNTPARGYSFDKYVINYKSGDEDKTSNIKTGKYTMPSSDITVTGEFKPLQSYTIYLDDKGSVINTIEGYEGENISELLASVSNPTTELTGYSFKGWAKVHDTENPEIVESNEVLTQNMTLYAVYGIGTGGGWSKVTSTSDFTAGTYAIISYDDAYYLTNAAATGSCPLTGEVSKSNGVIVFTDEMKWTAAESDGGLVFESYKESNKYLWGGTENNATRVNTTSGKSGATNIWKPTNNDEYGVIAYVNVGTNAATKKYLSTYGEQDWRNYASTSVDNRAANFWKYNEGNFTYSFDEPVTLTGAPSDGLFYATFIGTTNMLVDDDSAIATCFVEDGVAKTMELEGTVIPANSPVIVYTMNESGKITLTPTSEEADAEDVEYINDENFNQLFGYTVDTHVDAVANTSYYALNVSDGQAGFFVPRTTDDTTNPSAASGFTAKAGKAYLKVVGAVSSTGYRIGGTTMVESLKAEEDAIIYDLLGRRVENATKGLYIINGKKVFVK